MIHTKKIFLLDIEKLEGGNFDLNTVLQAITTIRDMAIKIGIALSCVSLIIGFIMLGIVDVEQKNRVKSKIIQTLVSIGGIVLAISLVNVVIGLFV